MKQSAFCIDSELIEEAEALVELLRAHRLTVITAESCTGGLIAAALSHARGASDCLHGGFVVYTKDCKAVALGVDRDLLARMGSVNAQVAHELARGAIEHSTADLAIAVTGVLGPEPDEDDNPPGQVYFGLAHRGEDSRVLAQHFSRDDPHE
ncbi:MAG TPA: CinA family protein, partial [Steroidobacteraceae bacterium]